MKKFKYMVLAVLLFVGSVAVASLAIYFVFRFMALLPEWLLYDIPLTVGVMLLIAGVLVQVYRLYRWLMYKNKK